MQSFQQRLDRFTVCVRIAYEVGDSERAAARLFDGAVEPRLRITEGAECGGRAVFALKPA